MDKTLAMHEIATAVWNSPDTETTSLGTHFCEDFDHDQWLTIYRVIKMFGGDETCRMLAGFLDPEGGDEDRLGVDIKGNTIVHRGDLGTYGYWKALPAELRAQIEADNS